MAAPYPPPTHRAWQYNSTTGGLDKNLKLNAAAAIPKPKPTQHLVEIFACALNPVDYKPAEVPYAGRLLVPSNATPGIDFSGRIAVPAPGSSFKRGDLIFGCAGTLVPFAGGACAEFASVLPKQSTKLPDGIDVIDAASVGVAGVTAYQSVVTRVKQGDRIFINGGSGGTGTYAIQFAKVVGCHVTTVCSTANVELCKSLGADVVIDYKKQNLIDTLIAGEKFDHGVDNVAADFDLLWRSHEFMKPGAALVVVGGHPTFASLKDQLKRSLLPKFLGGIKGRIDGFWPDAKPEDLDQIGQWMKEGKVKAVIDQQFSFEETPAAFTKLKTGRARGKVVIDVASGKATENSKA